jgi:hypothetical protein
MDYRELSTTEMMVLSLSLGASPVGGVFHAIGEAQGTKKVCNTVVSSIGFAADLVQAVRAILALALGEN